VTDITSVGDWATLVGLLAICSAGTERFDVSSSDLIPHNTRIGVTMTTLVGTLTKAGAIHKVENGFVGLPKMDEPGTEAAIGDSFHNPEGSVMSAGFFELKASEPLVYTYTYDEMKVVVQGEFILTDQKTGDVTRAKERDVLFFPKGTTVKFETPDYALGFFTGERNFAP
jgi:ethanolamine utilization protein EutQ (cupin superfamily)